MLHSINHYLLQKPMATGNKKSSALNNSPSYASGSKNPVLEDSISISRKTPKFSGARDSLETAEEQLSKLHTQRYKLSNQHSKVYADYEKEKNSNDDAERANENRIKICRERGFTSRVANDAYDGARESMIQELEDKGLLERDSSEPHNILSFIRVPAPIKATWRGVRSTFGDSETLKKAVAAPKPCRALEQCYRQQASQLWGSLQTTIEHYNELHPKVSRGKETLETLNQIITLAREAIDATPFHEGHYKAVYHGLRQTPYREVESHAFVAKTHLSKIPGVGKAYIDATDDIWDDNGVAELLKDLRSTSPETQSIALKRLYPLEGGRPKESKIVYPEFLRHKQPLVAKTALEMMTRHPEIRLEEEAFNTVLIEFLNSGNAVMAETALNTIHQLAMKDSAIDTVLKQLAHPKSSLTPALRDKAITLWNRRRELGLVDVKDPEKDAQKMLEPLVGNQEVVNKLKVLLGNYYHAQENTPDSISPGLIMYLPGKAGIGKTTLINHAQAVLSNGKKSLIHIKPKNINTDEKFKDLGTMLRKSTPPNKDGMHDLSGKILFFDEFQGVDSIKPRSAQKKFLEDMKDLFAVDKADIKDAHKWLTREKLVLKNPVMAIATNDPLSAKYIEALETSQGDALMDRLSLLTRPGSVNKIELSNDLKSYVPEFVKQFGPKQYFQNIEKRDFLGPLTLTPAAQTVLTKKLAEQTTETEGRVSGRKLALWIVEDINAAIKRTESNTRQQFLRTTIKDAEGNPKSIVSQALTVDVDSTRALRIQG